MPETPQEQPLELPGEGPSSAKAWQSRIQESKDLIQWHRDRFNWNTNNQRFVGKGGEDAPTGMSGKRVALLPKDYAYAEQKKPLLCYQLAEVVLTPKREDVTPQAAQLFGAVLNDLVGPNQLNALPTLHEVLADLIVTAGVGAVVIGYETFIDPQEPKREVQVGEQPAPLDPFTGMPPMDPMTGQPVMLPIMESVPNVVSERYFLERISPDDFLFDAGFRKSDWAKCPWLGYKSRMEPHKIARLYGIKETDLPRGGVDSMTPDPKDSLAPDREVQKLSGLEVVTLYFKAVEFDATAADPDLVMELVFVEGRDKPLRYAPSASQRLEGNRVVGGLRRPPIFPVTLRYASDSALTPSDSSMTRPIVDELSLGRTQMWEQRDRNVPMRGADISRMTPENIVNLRAGKTQEIHLFDGLQPGEMPLFGLPQSAFPQENFNFNSIGERDLQEAWALSGVNLGVSEASGRTATESVQRQQGTENRMGSEQAKFELFYVSIVQGLAALVQEFADLPQYVRVVGEQGAAVIQQWTKQDIAGEYAFSVRPDSSKRVDQTAERKFRLDSMNLLMNVPGINKSELVKWAAPSLGLDPAKIFQEPQPAPPEPPKITLSIATESLNPMAPEYQATKLILKSRGIDIEPQPAPPQAPPGGAPPPGGLVTAGQGAPPINKHGADQTGQLPGGGAASPAQA